MEQTNRPMFLRWVLAFAIIVVLNLFFTFAIRLGYKEPQYDKFCPQKQVNKVIDNEKACTDIGGQWSENPSYLPAIDEFGRVITDVPSSIVKNQKEPVGWCNEYFTCQKEFNEVVSVYNRNVFVILIILGVISLGAGYAIGVSSAVSLGLSLGGVLALIIASIRYWSDMDDLVRVVVLAIALAALIWFGVKKFKD